MLAQKEMARGHSVHALIGHRLGNKKRGVRGRPRTVFSLLVSGDRPNTPFALPVRVARVARRVARVAR